MKKIKAIINPLEGIILDDKKILMGMSKSEVIPEDIKKTGEE